MLEDDDVTEVLAVLRQRTGFDFSQYRQTTVARRIRNRMLSIPLSTPTDYLTRLYTDPDEATRLAERLTIKVSRFYRNAATFDLLRATVLPALSRGRGNRPLRLWSAGCGCGEEPYTLAMLLDDAGIEGDVEASDIDGPALERAREGVYGPDAATELPETFVERYLGPAGGTAHGACRVRDTLRRRVRFSHHDILSGEPPPGVEGCDLIACRNVLIYLQPDAQERALATVLGAGEAGSVVFLGEAEWPTRGAAARLEPIHPRQRIFRIPDTSPGGTM